EILEKIVSNIAAPKGNAVGDLRALLFDSWYDSYRGVVCLVRIVDGEIRKGMRVKLLSTGRIYEVTEMGIFTPKAKAVERVGVRGLLHMEIIQERLEREFNLELLTSAPGVRYRVTKTNGDVIEIENPQKMPDPAYIRAVEEPFLEVTILTTDEFVGPILALAIDRRGQQKKLEYVSSNRVMLVYEMPLNEVILDFFDKLKSISRGYASLDY